MKKVLGAEEKKSEAKRAADLYTLFTAANTAERQNWEYNSSRCEDFYNDRQLTAEELTDLKKATMPTFTVNRVTPVVEIMKYFLTAGRPRWKTVGRDTGGYDTRTGQIHVALSDYCYDLSDGNTRYSQVVHDSLVKQCGYMHIFVDKNADRGMGEVMFGSIEPRYVFVDPESRDKFYRDAKFVMIAKNMTKSALKQELPQYTTEIDKASGHPIGVTAKSYWNALPESIVGIHPSTGEAEEMISYFECYKPIRVPYVSFMQKLPVSEGKLREMTDEATVRLTEAEKELGIRVEELKVRLIKAVTEGQTVKERAEFEIEKMQREGLSYLKAMRDRIMERIEEKVYRIEKRAVRQDEYKKLIKNPITKSTIVEGSDIEYYERKIMIECAVGDQLLYWRVLNISSIPIIPLPFIHTGSVYPLGAVVYLIGTQQMVNKSYQITVHHANISSNPVTFARAGSIVNIEEAREEITMPGGFVIYEGESPPLRVLPLPLNNAFYTIAETGKADLEYTAGISSYMMGMARATNEPFRSTMAMDEFSTRRLKYFLSGTVEPFLVQVGKVFKEVAQSVYSAHKIWRIATPGAGMTEAEEQEYEINAPRFDATGAIVGKYFDYQASRFDVEVVAGSVWPVSKEALENKFFEYYQKNAIDRTELWKHMENIDKIGLAKRLSEIDVLRRRLEEIDEENKSLKGDRDTLHRQVLQANIKVDSIRGALETKKDVLETEAMQRNLRTQMDNAKKAFARELEQIVSAARKEVELIKKEEKVKSKEKK